MKRIMPDGSMREIWPADRPVTRTDETPVRASHVKSVPGGFSVDFSPLADATGLERFRLELPEVFVSYAAAVAAEVSWLRQNYVMEGISNVKNPTG